MRRTPPQGGNFSGHSSTLCKLCAVQARMCSTNQAHHHYERGCAVRVRLSFSTSENVQYKRVDHQVLVQGGTTQKYFPINESLLLLTYPVKTWNS